MVNWAWRRIFSSVLASLPKNIDELIFHPERVQIEREGDTRRRGKKQREAALHINKQKKRIDTNDMTQMLKDEKRDACSKRMAIKKIRQ